jgi:hypothetical protein
MFPETGLDAYMASWGKVKDKDEIMFVARNFTFANSKTGSIQLFILSKKFCVLEKQKRINKLIHNCFVLFCYLFFFF